MLWLVAFLITINVGLAIFAHSIANRISTAPAEAEPKVNLREALRLTREGLLDDAMAEYRRCAREFPESPEPLFGLAFLLRQESRTSEADGVYRDMLQRFNDDDVTWNNVALQLAEMLREDGDTAGAEELEAAVNARNPDHRFGYVTAKTQQKRVATERDEWEGSLEYLEMDRARALVERGRIDDAVALFKRYAAEHPGEFRPLLEAAATLEAAERHEEAVSMLQDIIQVFQGDDVAWSEGMMRLATIHENVLGDREGARHMLSQVQARLRYTETGQIAQERLDAL